MICGMYLQVKFVLLATHYFTNSIIKVRIQDGEQLHGGPCNPPPPLIFELILGLLNDSRYRMEIKFF